MFIGSSPRPCSLLAEKKRFIGVAQSDRLMFAGCGARRPRGRAHRATREDDTTSTSWITRANRGLKRLNIIDLLIFVFNCKREKTDRREYNKKRAPASKGRGFFGAFLPVRDALSIVAKDANPPGRFFFSLGGDLSLDTLRDTKACGPNPEGIIISSAATYIPIIPHSACSPVTDHPFHQGEKN